MLEILLAIKNNNMRKIPNYDTSHMDHLKKLLKGYVKGMVWIIRILIIGIFLHGGGGHCLVDKEFILCIYQKLSPL